MGKRELCHRMIMRSRYIRRERERERPMMMVSLGIDRRMNGI